MTRKSQVISFRLDPKNNDDAEALAILEGLEQDYDRRYIMRSALFALAERKIPPSGDAILLRTIAELSSIVHELSTMKLDGGSSREFQQLQQRASGVSKGFLSSISGAVKDHSD